MRDAERDDVLDLTPMPLTAIDVDVDGLRDFRGFLARELDTNLRPGAAGITGDHGLGAHFGSDNPGTNVQAARTRYLDALQASMNNLAQYISVTEILVEVIQTITGTYTEADLASAARSTDVHTKLMSALAAAVGTRSVAPQSTVDQGFEADMRMTTGLIP